MDSDNLEANKNIALRFLELAFGMRMQDAIEMLSADATWWVIGDPEKVPVAGPKNREQAVNMMTRMHKVLPDGMRHRVSGITAERDRVAMEVEAEGKWHDGRPYRNTYHFLFRIEENKVVAIREYMDPGQIPASPKPR